MSLNSVNTNTNAYIALQSLNQTSAGLAAAQKQISTGYRVADASDDGAAFAVAQKVRSDVGGLTTVNQQLGNAAGLVGVAQTALTSISNAFTSAKSLLVDIANASTSTDQRAQYVTQYQQLVSQVANAVDGSTYNGQSLLGNSEGTAGASFSVVVNEGGTEVNIAAQDQSTVANTLAGLIGETFTRTVSTTTGVATDAFGATGTEQATAATSLVTGGSYDTAQAAVSTSLNTVGSNANFLNSTITFNNNKISSLNSGLGSLIDADLTQESAVLQSLQIKQQLGTQALSIANQSPQSLLSLFK